MLGHKYESVLANTGSCKIWESNDETLLGVNINHNLEFSHYILKAGLSALVLSIGEF